MPETELPAREQIEETVRLFAADALMKLRHQASSMVSGGDSGLPPDIWHQNIIERCMEPQEWLVMALYGAGLSEQDSGYIYEICQSIAEWLFAIPGSSTYEIPDAWAETDMGALWMSAMIRIEGDDLITLTEAARLSGVALSTLTSRIERGKLRSYTNPAAANPRRGGRLVRRSDVLPVKRDL